MSPVWKEVSTISKVSSFGGTYTRPLGVQGSLRPEHEILHSGEALLNDLGRVGCLSGSSGRVPCTSSTLSLVDDIDNISFVEEVSCPSRGSIWLDQPVLWLILAYNLSAWWVQ